MSLPDLIFIFLLALVILGPKKLPIVAGQLGKWMAEFKRASNEFKNQLETEMMNIELEERAKKDGENAKAFPLLRPHGRAVGADDAAVDRFGEPDQAGICGDGQPGAGQARRRCTA